MKTILQMIFNTCIEICLRGKYNENFPKRCRHKERAADITVVKMVSYSQSFFISPITDKNSDDLIGLWITRLSSKIRLVYAAMTSPAILPKHSAKHSVDWLTEVIVNIVFIFNELFEKFYWKSCKYNRKSTLWS